MLLCKISFFYYNYREHSTLDEERINIIGRVAGMLILFVVATDRNGNIRIISARKAEPDEEAEYYARYNIG
ncbi:MAG: BrnT family toxin [Spirochaetales bacterium]|nr:BrnT family toxin [Spirochaetales bacterium]